MSFPKWKPRSLTARVSTHGCSCLSPFLSINTSDLIHIYTCTCLYVPPLFSRINYIHIQFPLSQQSPAVYQLFILFSVFSATTPTFHLLYQPYLPSPPSNPPTQLPSLPFPSFSPDEVLAMWTEGELPQVGGHELVSINDVNLPSDGPSVASLLQSSAVLPKLSLNLFYHCTRMQRSNINTYVCTYIWV